ncbi:MAG: hypothetical protein P4L80_12140 [Xanthobacteraceae bacterium]|nr:hypothetical protein [Xanthobacteraceae bacterium]
MLRDKSEVPAMMPVIAEAASAMKALGLGVEGLPFALKGAELLGDASDPKRLTNYLDNFIKAKETLGDLVTTEGIYEFAKYSKASGSRLSDRYATTMGPLLAAELGGTTAGVELSAFEKVMAGGGAHADYVNMIKLGLANKSDFILTKTGEVKGLKLGHHIKDSDLAATDPDLYIKDKLLPALIAHGFDTRDKQIEAVRRIYQDRSSQDFVIKTITQMSSFESHLVALNQAMGLSAAQMLVHTDAALALSAAETQLEGLFSEMTNPAMGMFAQGLAGVAEGLAWAKSGIHSLAEWAPKSAAALSALTTSAIALGGGWLTLKTFMNFMGLGGAQAKLGAAGLSLDGAAAALDGSAAALNEAAAALATGGKAGAIENALGGKGGAIAGGAALGAGAIAGITAGVVAAGAVGGVGLGVLLDNTKLPGGKSWAELESDPHAKAVFEDHVRNLEAAQRNAERETPIGLGAVAPPDQPMAGEMAPYDGPWLTYHGKLPIPHEDETKRFASGGNLFIPDANVPGGGWPSLHDLGTWLVKEMPSVFSRPDKPVDVQGKVSGDAELHITVDASGISKTQTSLRLDGTIGRSNVVPSGDSWSGHRAH